jgi:hypothetical protein
MDQAIPSVLPQAYGSRSVQYPRECLSREEELSDLGNVSFECLSTLLHYGVEGGFKDVALIEVRSIVARVSTLHA